MKTFVLSLLKFFLFAILFYVVFICVGGLILPDFLRRNLLSGISDTGQTNRRLAEADTTDMVDILFLGSSRAYRGFDTRIFAKAGYTSFNLGTSNQSPEQSYYLLQKYVVKLQPKTVIFEVNPDIFSGDGAESATDIITHSKPDIELLKMTWAVRNIKAVNGFIFSCLRYIFFVGKQDKVDSENVSNPYVPGGYIATKDSMYNEDKGNAYYCELNDDQLAAFDKIVKFLHTKEIRTLLVQAPVVEKLYNTCPENEKFDKLMKNKGIYYNFNLSHHYFGSEKLTGTRFDLGTKLTETTYFSDGQHLNQKGVEIFNEWLLKLLK